MFAALLDTDDVAPGAVSLSNENLFGSNAASCGITYKNDGTVTAVATTSPTSPVITPANTTVVAFYEIHVAASGDTAQLNGTVNTWLALTSDRQWLLNAAPLGESYTVTLTVQIREAASGIVRGSATVALNTATI